MRHVGSVRRTVQAKSESTVALRWGRYCFYQRTRIRTIQLTPNAKKNLHFSRSRIRIDPFRTYHPQVSYIANPHNILLFFANNECVRNGSFAMKTSEPAAGFLMNEDKRTLTQKTIIGIV